MRSKLSKIFTPGRRSRDFARGRQVRDLYTSPLQGGPAGQAHPPHPLSPAEPDGIAAGACPLVRLEGVGKSFGKIHANRDISLAIYPGRVLALLGENGAGKSTLMGILAGRLQPDAGRIFVDGQPVKLRGPAHSLRLGIGMVYQRFSLVNNMTVAENVLLGQERSLILDPAERAARVAAMARDFGLPVDPNAKINGLSMGERQRVEILRLLARDSRVLILDEPTAVLTPPEADQLFAALGAMAGRGRGIVFISHKLDEVLALADHIAVLRRGRLTASLPAAQVEGKAQLAELMVGKGVVQTVDKPPVPLGQVVLEARGLTAPSRGGARLQGVDLRLRQGEVLAVVGVAGNGQKPLVEVLAGLLPPQSGDLSLLGLPAAEFFDSKHVNKLAYVPEDRLGMGTVPELDLTGNYLLTERRAFCKGPALRADKARDTVQSLIAAHDVRPDDPRALAGSLSGGNLQKFVLARELSRQPGLILAEQPTQGLDVRAAEDVWRRLLEARAQAGILLVTGDLAEALALADRMAVMVSGRFQDVFPVSDAAKVERIGLMMAGVPGEQ